MVTIGSYQTNLDMMIRSKNSIVALGLFDNSQQRIKAVSAILNIQNVKIRLPMEEVRSADNYLIYNSPVVVGKEKFYHAILINKEIQQKFVVTSAERAANDFYNWLMNTFTLPLVPWWGQHLLNFAIREGQISPPETKVYYGNNSQSKYRFFEGIHLDDMIIYDVGNYTEENLIYAIKTLFDRDAIWISKNPQQPLDVTTLDNYFEKYGSGIVDALKASLNPLSGLNGNCSSLVLRNKRLFPQQAAMVNGVLELLKHKKCAFLIEGMGVGKVRRCGVMKKYV